MPATSRFNLRYPTANDPARDAPKHFRELAEDAARELGKLTRSPQPVTLPRETIHPTSSTTTGTVTVTRNGGLVSIHGKIRPKSTSGALRVLLGNDWDSRYFPALSTPGFTVEAKPTTQVVVDHTGTVLVIDPPRGQFQFVASWPLNADVTAPSGDVAPTSWEQVRTGLYARTSLGGHLVELRLHRYFGGNTLPEKYRPDQDVSFIVDTASRGLKTLTVTPSGAMDCPYTATGHVVYMRA